MIQILGFSARLAIACLAMGTAIFSTLNPMGPIGLVLLPYSAMGAVLILRRPRTSIGWILIGLGVCWALISVQVTTPPEDFADGSVALPVAAFAIIHAGLPATLFFLYAVLVMVFPSGRVPPGRWGRLATVGLGAALVFTAAAYVLPEIGVGATSEWARNPIALLPDLPIWRVVNPATVVLPALILTLVGSVAMLVRARRATGLERQQLRWIGASFALVTSAVVSGFVISLLFPGSESGLAWTPAILAFPTVPIAVAIAVLRYRLYDIDRIISRTIGWAIVSGTLLAIFGAAVVGLQAVLAEVTQGQTLAVAASTLVAFALFQPLRRRVQAAVNRRFDRARVDADRTATAFADRLRDQIDLGGLEADIAGTVQGALRPSSTGVWIREASR